MEGWPFEIYPFWWYTFLISKTSKKIEGKDVWKRVKKRIFFISNQHLLGILSIEFFFPLKNQNRTAAITAIFSTREWLCHFAKVLANTLHSAIVIQIPFELTINSIPLLYIKSKYWLGYVLPPTSQLRHMSLPSLFILLFCLLSVFFLLFIIGKDLYFVLIRSIANYYQLLYIVLRHVLPLRLRHMSLPDLLLSTKTVTFVGFFLQFMLKKNLYFI